MRVLIDDLECDYTSSSDFKLRFSSTDMSNLDSARSGTTMEVLMPRNQNNAAIFGCEAQLHTASRFNEQWHPMRFEVDGVTLFEGTAYLMEVVWSGNEEYFRVECRGDVEAWALRGSQSSMADVSLDGFYTYLNQEGIESTWEESSVVKFFAVDRDSYTTAASGDDMTGVQKIRTIDDYHPFINIKALIESFLSQYGYTIESSIFESEDFANLFVSGNYASSESSNARSTMGFYLKRGEDTTTTCNSTGRIYLSPYLLSNTFGNVVDVLSPTYDQECYNYGNVMQIDGKELVFVPLTTTYAGFEYRLHYTTSSQILSRTELKGINSLRYADGYTIEWQLQNGYVDQRDSVVANVEYNVAIFDYDASCTYRIVGVDSDSSHTPLGLLTSRFSGWTPTVKYDSYIVQQSYDGSFYTNYEGDWALYFGYVEEYNMSEVDVCVRSAPSQFTSQSPMRFAELVLEGGIAGGECTLMADSYLKPYFAYYPGYNSKVWLSDIAVQDFTMLDLMSAIQHQFNLRFYSDESSKRIFIDPVDDFYTDVEWDWSDKVIESEDVEFMNFAHTANRSNKLGYQQTDGVVNRLGESDNATFGEWEYSINSYAASATDKTTLNPIFSATVNSDEGVLLVGDRDDETSVDSLNFSPRVVRYFDMREIEAQTMPYASFYDVEENFNLCFEDRDSMQGLNSYYQSQCESQQRADLISLKLTLNAVEYTNLFSPDDINPSLRDIFLFSLKGETFRCRLYSVESYNIVSREARCTFLTIN